MGPVDYTGAVNQAVDMFISAVKLDIVTRAAVDQDSLLKPVSQRTAIFPPSGLVSVLKSRTRCLLQEHAAIGCN